MIFETRLITVNIWKDYHVLIFGTVKSEHPISRVTYYLSFQIFVTTVISNIPNDIKPLTVYLTIGHCSYI